MLAPSDIQLTGKWSLSKGQMVPDETCEKIARLTNGYLVKLANDPSGWDSLFRDPVDGRLWELIYPQSELHGGGPPTLRYLSKDEADRKYGLLKG